MDISLIRPAVGAAAAPVAGKKIADAAGQFEALLIAQMLKSSHSSGDSWLGTNDPTSSSLTDMAEEHLATTLSAQGGLGLARMIVHQMEPAPQGSQAPAMGHALTAGSGPDVR